MSEDKDSVEKLSEALATMSEAMSKVMTSNDLQAKILRMHAEISENFREDIRDVKKTLEKIIHVLHEGNGEKPLITRVALLEEKYSGIKERLKEDQEEDSKEEEVSSTSRITLWAATIGVGGAIIGSIITALLQKIM
jgi:hypothetical protein